jgi:hypothetical protein
MIRELFVWGKYVTFNYFREKTKIHKRNLRQVARAPPPSPTPFSLPPLYIYVTQWQRPTHAQRCRVHIRSKVGVGDDAVLASTGLPPDRKVGGLEVWSVWSSAVVRRLSGDWSWISCRACKNLGGWPRENGSRRGSLTCGRAKCTLRAPTAPHGGKSQKRTAAGWRPLVQGCPGGAVGRVGNFRQKNNSAEDGIDGTNGYFRRNSGCSAKQKISEFRSEPFRGRVNISEFQSVEQK